MCCLLQIYDCFVLMKFPPFNPGPKILFSKLPSSWKNCKTRAGSHTFLSGNHFTASWPGSPISERGVGGNCKMVKNPKISCSHIQWIDETPEKWEEFPRSLEFCQIGGSITRPPNFAKLVGVREIFPSPHETWAHPPLNQKLLQPPGDLIHTLSLILIYSNVITSNWNPQISNLQGKVRDTNCIEQCNECKQILCCYSASIHYAVLCVMAWLPIYISHVLASTCGLLRWILMRQQLHYLF